ncbi:hypothetical protein O7632_12340 [Solwaraspora sp. WMMD406]|uniref:hypothetical protein n=1 Tax=Solwaraspora sp. WMMD406 TaxID=3016095 RepID=UPI002417E9E2|nr:hypothetical protein [Solwaraspora sp. WMMD406]MDG4764882.1 hypothetical protein [Solwaraspora sp. WMMD406]
MWGLLRRAPRLPAAKRPPLDRDERVLAWSRAAAAGEPTADSSATADAGPAGDDDAVLVVTNRGLWLPGHPSRLGWHEVHKAVWSGADLTIVPAEVTEERDGYTVVADGSPYTLVLPDPAEVPHQIRARVTGSVGYSVHHGGDFGGVRVVGRRVPGIDGVRWTVRYDPDADLESPESRALTDALVATARASVGQEQ